MTIRRRLLFTVMFSSAIMFIGVLYVSMIVNTVVKSVSTSYETNVRLDAYSKVLLQTEQALENYMSFRTFESIDGFYNFRARLDEMQMGFPRFPDTDPVALLEFKIQRIVASFVVFANQAVAARRANDIVTANKFYIKALETYGLLRGEISELNSLYFSRNISQYNESVNTIRSSMGYSLLLILFVIVLCIVLVYVLITNITLPLASISRVADRISERDFDLPLLPEDMHDEVGTICRAFNRMIVSIREYIDTIWEKAIQEAELHEKEISMTALYNDAKLKALQSQINPHFLFNTLNTGAQLAMMEDADKTCHFIEQVADFYRYNIQQKNQDATLSDELALVDNYIYIMKVRFGNKFEFEKSIDCDCSTVKIPCMILQPLIENCINHGLKEIAENGLIRLAVYHDDDSLCITISDNGTGFPQDVRTAILEETTFSGTGIGMSNVVSRLRGYFNRRDIFDILPNPSGAGTLFMIRIKNV